MKKEHSGNKTKGGEMRVSGVLRPALWAALQWVAEDPFLVLLLPCIDSVLERRHCDSACSQAKLELDNNSVVH